MGRKFADKYPTFDGDLSLGRVLAMRVDGLRLVGSSITGLHLAIKWLDTEWSKSNRESSIRFSVTVLFH
jgi:hypothetical protein